MSGFSDMGFLPQIKLEIHPEEFSFLQLTRPYPFIRSFTL
jgi:hypothetical protein